MWVDVHTAAVLGDVRWMTYLLAQDPSWANAPDRTRRSPLQPASMMRPLHLAASAGSEEVVDLLIQGGADVTAGDAMLRSALHIASMRGQSDAVRVLLGHTTPLDLLARDVMGKTALDYAVEKGDSETLALLTDGTQRGERLYLCLKLRAIKNSNSMVARRRQSSQQPPAAFSFCSYAAQGTAVPTETEQGGFESTPYKPPQSHKKGKEEEQKEDEVRNQQQQGSTTLSSSSASSLSSKEEEEALSRVLDGLICYLDEGLYRHVIRYI